MNEALALEQTPHLGPKDSIRLEGEKEPWPYSTAKKLVMGLSGLWFLISFFRFVFRVTLGYRRPTVLYVDARGIHIKSSTIWLKKTYRTEEHFIPFGQIVWTSSETRYASLASTSGLFFMGLGGFLGGFSLLRSAQSGALSLVVMAFFFLAAGVMLDTLIQFFFGAIGGRVRFLLRTSDQKPWCIAKFDVLDLEEMFSVLARLNGESLTPLAPAVASAEFEIGKPQSENA